MTPVQIVGALNVTPDSFHDGGRYVDVDLAVRRAMEMVNDGADIVEIGGESTGPASPPITQEEELSRVIPVLRAVRKGNASVRLGIDTYKSAVARQAIEAGASIINDVTAGREDPEIFKVASETGAHLVLMYAKDATPRTTVEDLQYDDVIATVKNFLRLRRDAAVTAGVPAEHIILDPGMGHFVSSDARYSLEIIAQLEEFLELGHPLFLSPSRKSFLAGPQNLPTKERLPGTIAASAIAVFNGASFIRTHDVLEIRRACDIAQTMRDSA
ncbi:MAG: dihydropteroate synthase [Phycisphaerales bacterium]|nr:dihydropteroate synthase [Phycisphaerales bacterium]